MVGHYRQNLLIVSIQLQTTPHRSGVHLVHIDYINIQWKLRSRFIWAISKEKWIQRGIGF